MVTVAPYWNVNGAVCGNYQEHLIVTVAPYWNVNWQKAVIDTMLREGNSSSILECK